MSLAFRPCGPAVLETLAGLVRRWRAVDPGFNTSVERFLAGLSAAAGPDGRSLLWLIEQEGVSIGLLAFGPAAATEAIWGTTFRAEVYLEPAAREGSARNTARRFARELARALGGFLVHEPGTAIEAVPVEATTDSRTDGARVAA